MTPRESSALQGRRLRAELRRIRTAMGRSRKEVADALDWSESKVCRIELGSVGLSITDLRALLNYFEIDDHQRIAEFVDMARAAKRKAWRDYRTALSEEFMKYLDYESFASIIRNFENFFVPGLLQTPEYAEVVMDVFGQGESQDVIKRRHESRMARQALIGRPDSPQMRFIVDESVVRRLIGGPAVMRRQLKHLKRIQQHPSVTIQVVRFEDGAHVGMTGSFVHLQFPNSIDPDLLYIENTRGDVFLRHNTEEVRAYLVTFDRLRKVATSADAFADMIDDAIDTLAPG